jgi:hypothetical protein
MAQQREEGPAGPVIWCYTGSVVITCGCGSPIPVVIPYHQGLSPTTRCRHCQGTYQLHSMSVVMGDANKDQFGISFKPHMMIEAASQMPDVPVSDVLNNVTPFGPIKR